MRAMKNVHCPENENCLYLKWLYECVYIVCVLMIEHREYPFGVSSRINYVNNMQNLTILALNDRKRRENIRVSDF